MEKLRVSITELKEKEKTAEQTIAAGRAAYKAGDYGKALMLLKSLAEKGNAEAQFLCGEACYSAQDETKAMQWYEKAVRQGHAKAQLECGTLYYLNGEKEERARMWLEKAADQTAGLLLAQAA